MTCMAWGRTLLGGNGGDNKVVNGDAVPRRVNVIATGSVDQSIKVSETMNRPSCEFGVLMHRVDMDTLTEIG